MLPIAPPDFFRVPQGVNIRCDVRFTFEYLLYSVSVSNLTESSPGQYFSSVLIPEIMKTPKKSGKKTGHNTLGHHVLSINPVFEQLFDM